MIEIETVIKNCLPVVARGEGLYDAEPDVGIMSPYFAHIHVEWPNGTPIRFPIPDDDIERIHTLLLREVLEDR